jgi:hypothetical protein
MFSSRGKSDESRFSLLFSSPSLLSSFRNRYAKSGGKKGADLKERFAHTVFAAATLVFLFADAGVGF